MENINTLQALLSTYVNQLTYVATEWYFIASSCIFAYLVYKNSTITIDSIINPDRAHINVFSRIINFFNFLFPKKYYFHRSTKTDLLYLLSFPLIAGIFFKPALVFGTAAFAYSATNMVLSTIFGDVIPSNPVSGSKLVLLSLGLTLSAALAMDFAFFIHHYLMHKIKFLWEFHKVHHSAETLTPLTDYRLHPIELFTIAHAKGLGLGFSQGVFNYAFGEPIEVTTLLGLNAVYCIYIFLAYPLRHSHVWVSYGQRLNHYFISPAQHQIHHSPAPKHWDKNFGGFFAIWDRMFGTLYVPKEKEDLTYGLSNGDTAQYQNFWNLYWLPFKTASRTKSGLITVIVLTLMFLIFSTLSMVRLFSMLF